MKQYKKVICYHHNDMDGIASAAIVKQIYPEAEFKEVNYGDEINIYEHKDKYIIIVDFSFSQDRMDGIYCGWKSDMFKGLCWIDHHKTAMLNNDALWNSDEIDGLREIGKSGALLTWQWFHPHEEIPDIIKYINDWDLWEFKFGRQTKRIYEYINLIIEDPQSYHWTWLLTDNNKTMFAKINEWCNFGETLLQAKHKRIEKTFKDGVDGEIDNHKCRIVNTNHDASSVGEYIWKEKGYPVALIFSKCNDKVIVNLRNNTVDVSKIAEKFGGGGHKNASGFIIPFKDIFEVI